MYDISHDAIFRLKKRRSYPTVKHETQLILFSHCFGLLSAFLILFLNLVIDD